jgi:hypothetical protein
MTFKYSFLAISLLLISLSINTAHAQDTVNIMTGNTNYTFVENLAPSFYVTSAINLLLGFAGIGSFIFLLWGGVQWITAGSDKEAVEKSRKKIVNALVGLAVVFSAYVLLFIVRILFNVDIIGFGIGRLGT